MAMGNKNKRFAGDIKNRLQKALNYNKAIIPKEILGCSLRESEIDEQMEAIQYQYIKIESNSITAVCYLYFFLEDRDWMATFDEGPDCLTGTPGQLVTTLCNFCHLAVDEMIEMKNIIDCRARGEEIPLSNDEIVAAFLAI